MENIEDIGKLEAIVEKLVASYNDLKQEKASLEAMLDQKEKELHLLQEKVEQLKGEKHHIHKRVTGLIDSIERWEKGTAGSGEEETSAEGAQSHIFSISGQ